MSTYKHQAASRTDIRVRAVAPSHGSQDRCVVFGCSRLTMRSAAEGLSHNYCRRHVEHIARHGHARHKTLSAKDLKPYRRAASKYLAGLQAAPASADAMLAASVETQIGRIMTEAGRPLSQWRLRDEGPEDRARQVLVRAREKGVTAARLTLEALAVVAALKGLDRRGGDEYRDVQIAKGIHRLAGGFNTERLCSNGALRVIHWYSEPRGRMLRRLGGLIWGELRHGFGSSQFSAVVEIADVHARERGQPGGARKCGPCHKREAS